jgi:hypothetical protein
MLIGSALYTDALKPASLLSLTLQDDDADVIHGIKGARYANRHSTMECTAGCP